MLQAHTHNNNGHAYAISSLFLGCPQTARSHASCRLDPLDSQQACSTFTPTSCPVSTGASVGSSSSRGPVLLLRRNERLGRELFSSLSSSPPRLLPRPLFGSASSVSQATGSHPNQWEQGEKEASSGHFSVPEPSVCWPDLLIALDQPGSLEPEPTLRWSREPA